MKFTVERDAFHDALSACMRRTKGGPDIPILSHVLIEAGDRRVTITGNDLDACSIARVAADEIDPGSAVIPADRLHRLTGGLPKGAMMSIETKDVLAIIRCGRSSYKFGTLPVVDFPNMPEIKGDPEPITLTSDQVVRLLDTPAVCIERQESRPYLAGVCMHPIRGGIAACATNGHTLIKTTVKMGRAEFPRIIVPERAAAEIAAMAKGGDIALRITDALISAECGDRTCISKLIDGSFPDYDRVIPQPYGEPIRADVKGIDAALDRLATARDPKRAGVVGLSWSAGQLTASLQSDQAAGEEALDADADREPGEVGAQVDYLRTLIQASGGEVVELHVGGPGDPIRITNPKDDGFVAVCMPCWL